MTTEEFEDRFENWLGSPIEQYTEDDLENLKDEFIDELERKADEYHYYGVSRSDF